MGKILCYCVGEAIGRIADGVLSSVSLEESTLMFQNAVVKQFPDFRGATVPMFQHEDIDAIITNTSIIPMTWRDFFANPKMKKIKFYLYKDGKLILITMENMEMNISFQG